VRIIGIILLTSLCFPLVRASSNIWLGAQLSPYGAGANLAFRNEFVKEDRIPGPSVLAGFTAFVQPKKHLQIGAELNYLLLGRQFSLGPYVLRQQNHTLSLALLLQPMFGKGKLKGGILLGPSIQTLLHAGLSGPADLLPYTSNTKDYRILGAGLVTGLHFHLYADDKTVFRLVFRNETGLRGVYRNFPEAKSNPLFHQFSVTFGLGFGMPVKKKP
jgi:hypothetical protein